MDYITKTFKLPHGEVLVDVFKHSKVRIVQNPNDPNLFQIRYSIRGPEADYISSIRTVQADGKMIDITAMSQYQQSGFKALYKVQTKNRLWHGRFIEYVSGTNACDGYSFFQDHIREGESISGE